MQIHQINNLRLFHNNGINTYIHTYIHTRRTLADGFVGEDVKRAELDVVVVENLDNFLAESAFRRTWYSLHEQHHMRCIDQHSQARVNILCMVSYGMVVFILIDKEMCANM